MEAEKYAQMTTKVALAVAIIRNKPDGISSKQFAMELSQKVANQNNKMKSKVQELEAEVLCLRQDLLLHKMYSKSSLDNDFVPDSPTTFPICNSVKDASLNEWKHPVKKVYRQGALKGLVKQTDINEIMKALSILLLSSFLSNAMAESVGFLVCTMALTKFGAKDFVAAYLVREFLFGPELEKMLDRSAVRNKSFSTKRSSRTNQNKQCDHYGISESSGRDKVIRPATSSKGNSDLGRDEPFIPISHQTERLKKSGGNFFELLSAIGSRMITDPEGPHSLSFEPLKDSGSMSQLLNDSGCDISNEDGVDALTVSQSSNSCDQLFTSLSSSVSLPILLPIKNSVTVGEGQLSSQIHFLNHLLGLRKLTTASNHPASLTMFGNDCSVIAESLTALLNGLFSLYENPKPSGSRFQTEAIQTVTNLLSKSSCLSKNIHQECLKRLEEFENRLIQSILTNSSVNRFQTQQAKVDCLYQLGKCSVLYGSLINLLFNEIKNYVEELLQLQSDSCPSPEGHQKD
ncbi:meiosis-specific protein MEI4 [Gastrophryne carolinensis]